MSERWPAAMPFRIACEYLGLKETQGRRVLDRLPCIQHDLGDPTATERSERYWLRSVLDGYLDARMRAPVGAGRKA